jgi:hypothetical protein
MDLSSPKLRKILVGVAIFVVVVFIVIRFFRRSNYAYPNASEEGSFSITAVPTIASGIATFTTTAPHGFSVGDLVYITGVSGITFTKPVTGYPPGATAGGATLAAGGSAVYINSIPASSTTQFTVEATQGQTLTVFTITTAGTGFTPGPATVTQGSTGKGTATITVTGALTPAGLTVVTGTGFATGNPITITQGSATATATFTGLATATIAVAPATVKSIVAAGMDKFKNTDALSCQTQYATDLVTSPSILTTTASQSLTMGANSTDAQRTLNVASDPTNMFSSGAKVLIPGILNADGKSVVLSVKSTTSSSIVFNIDSTVVSPATVLPQTAVANITTAYNARDACVKIATQTYTTTHCRYLPQPPSNRPVVPTQSDDPAAYASYNTYQQNIQAITTAYAPAISRAQQTSNFATTTGSWTTLPTSPFTWNSATQQAVVEAARKADLANATQKYLASVCPGFYAKTVGLVTTDDSATYRNWVVATTDPGSGYTDTNNKKFYAPAGGITDVSIMKWALGAGVVTLSGPVTSVTIPANTTAPAGITNGSSVTFSAPTSGTTATGTAVVSGGMLTGVTLTNNGGSGYTSSPTITNVPTATVNISTSLNATAALIPSGVYRPTGAAASISYNTTKYAAVKSGGTAGTDEFWRIAYKNGPGTYPLVYDPYAA